jgi:eukaryotic-like serine/threonine-protein kinase
MAMVYLAHDPLMDRQVAVKVLPRQFTFDPNFRSRFQREAKIIARLEHPAIVPVYDFGEYDDQPYLVMRYMAGGSLRQRLKDGPLPLDEVARLYGRLAPALDKAHRQNIIHRDLKPDNVLFDDEGLPYLADFGIARLAEASQTMTVAGTPAYMSPEQVHGKRRIDGRSDIYALGAMLFELLAGRPPYAADTNAQLMFKHAYEPVPDVRQANPALPAVAQTVIERAMAKEPDDRYGTAGELVTAVRQLAGPPPAAAKPAPAAVEPTAVDSPPPAAAPEPLTGSTAIDSPPPPVVARWEPVPAAASPERVAEETAIDGPPPPGVTPAPVPGGQGWLLPAGAVAIILIVGVALLLIFGLRGLLAGGGDPEIPAATSEIANVADTPGPTQRPTQTATPTPAQSIPPANAEFGDTWTRPADGMVMVYVPAGSFLMGSAADDPDADDDEFPLHQVFLDAFWLDKREVTNEQYEMCVAYRDCLQSGRANDRNFNGARQPVVSVSWEDAAAYCAWAGGRLPTEAQWEYAARGPDSLRYPWGNGSPIDTRLNYNGNVGRTTDVGSYPAGASWVETLDMAGNVWEWVADWNDEDYYVNSPDENPAGPASGQSRMLRGGGWDDGAGVVRGANRVMITATYRFDSLGFRCSVPQA